MFGPGANEMYPKLQGVVGCPLLLAPPLPPTLLLEAPPPCPHWLPAPPGPKGN